VRVYTEIRDLPQGDDDMIDTTLGGEKKKERQKRNNESLSHTTFPLLMFI
jgi:hypothetical protein